MEAPIIHRVWPEHPTLPDTLFAEVPPLSYPMFRYGRFAHFEAFMRTGSLRLGTLFSYRDEELLGDMVGDRGEGVRLLNCWGESKIPILAVMSAINGWMLCMTSERQGRFYTDFGADCCFSITSPLFFIEIARALDTRYFAGSVAAVDYLADDQLADLMVERLIAQAPPPLCSHLKLPRYSHQREIRAIWEPPSPAGEKARLNRGRTGWVDGHEEGIEANRAYHEPWRVMNDPANLPDLEPIFVSAPRARPYAQLVERRARNERRRLRRGRS